MTRDSRRVRTSKQHARLYSEFKGILVQDFHELFFLSACIGYRNDCPVRLERAGDERFWSNTITPEEWSAYYCMVLRRNNMDFNAILDDGAVLATVEEYAHGGLLYLIENILGGFLVEKDGEYSVDRTVVKDLPRRVMQFVFEAASNG